MSRSSEDTKRAQKDEAMAHLLAAIDELNSAFPLVTQAAWARVVLWSRVCRDLTSRKVYPTE